MQLYTYRITEKRRIYFGFLKNTLWNEKCLPLKKENILQIMWTHFVLILFKILVITWNEASKELFKFYRIVMFMIFNHMSPNYTIIYIFVNLFHSTRYDCRRVMLLSSYNNRIIASSFLKIGLNQSIKYYTIKYTFGLYKMHHKCW